MPTLNIMPKENLQLPRLSVSIYMIARLVLLCLNTIIIGIIGYYFAYYLGSYRHNLFHEELMLLVCAVSAFINTVITVREEETRGCCWDVCPGDGGRLLLLPPGGGQPGHQSCRAHLERSLRSPPRPGRHGPSHSGWNCFVSFASFLLVQFSDVDIRKVFRGSLRGEGLQWSAGPC